MRTFVVSVVALAVSLCAGGQARAQGFSDTICPSATQYVIAVGKLRKDDPPQRIYDASQAATDAYERCSKEKLSNGFREAQHYADIRAGQFAVVAARALVVLNRPDDARKELEHWRPLVQQVVDWQAETETSQTAMRPGDPESVSRSSAGASGLQSSDKRASMYRASAKEIVVAIDAELAKIAEQARALARPQAPVPSPSPAHY
jgi:hypothetical protein